jgi:hypothetical protein
LAALKWQGVEKRRDFHNSGKGSIISDSDSDTRMKTGSVSDLLSIERRASSVNRRALLVGIGLHDLRRTTAKTRAEISSGLHTFSVVARIAAALFFASTFCGCAKVMSYWPHKTESTLPPVATAPRPLGIESSGIIRPPARRHGAKKTSATPSPPTTGPSGNAATASSPAGPDVTLAGESDNHAVIEQLLNAIDVRLARVDRHALSTQDDAAWKQATSFVNAGRQALSHQNYLTASGYAHKASALVGKLPLAPQP